MPLRVLVVDDSRFFRRRVTEILNADPKLEVVGTAENGEEAIKVLTQLNPDIITMDIEMPVMDGITAVRRIMATRPTPIIMFSSLTTEGARSTLEALDAGAVDFLPKRFKDIAQDTNEAKNLLCEKVAAIARSGAVARTSLSKPEIAKPAVTKPADIKPAPPPQTTLLSTRRSSIPRPQSVLHSTRGSTVPSPVSAFRAPLTQDISEQKHSIRKVNHVSASNLKLLAIGTSTGGPVALLNILSKLPANLPVPILLVQHMPGTFTKAFAERLDQACAITVKEAEDGDELRPGLALLAPGGKQMVVKKVGAKNIVNICDAEISVNYKPCVDITFTSIKDVYHGSVLAIVLTGMGADGREGVRALKGEGCEIWAQDETSCVVFGMPHAVIEAGMADQVYALSEIGNCIARKVL